MFWVTDEKHTLDGVEVGTGDAGQGVDGCCGALRIALKNKAFVGIASEGSLDVVDDLKDCFSFLSRKRTL